ncbi:hypothetical protein D3C73_1560040 [compost metagenome]
MDKAVEAERVGHQPHLPAPADTGQGQLLRQGRRHLVLGQETERQLVATAHPVTGDLDFAE